MDTSVRDRHPSTHQRRNTTRRPEPARPTDTLECSICNDEMAQIDLLVDGRPLTLRACTACGHREWYDATDPVPLDGVLAVITESSTRYRRNMSEENAV